MLTGSRAPKAVRRPAICCCHFEPVGIFFIPEEKPKIIRMTEEKLRNIRVTIGKVKELKAKQ
jgi:hypothetical protein